MQWAWGKVQTVGTLGSSEDIISIWTTFQVLVVCICYAGVHEDDLRSILKCAHIPERQPCSSTASWTWSDTLQQVVAHLPLPLPITKPVCENCQMPNCRLSGRAYTTDLCARPRPLHLVWKVCKRKEDFKIDVGRLFQARNLAYYSSSYPKTQTTL